VHMRPCFFAASLIAISSFSSGASAQEGAAKSGSVYTAVSIGIIKPNDVTAQGYGQTASLSYDPGLLITGAYGVHLNSAVRLELELGYGNSKYGTLTYSGGNRYVGGDINMYSYLAGLYIDLPTSGSMTPYIGGGAGVVTTSNYYSTNTNFAFFGEIGLAFRISPTVSVVPSVRYIQINDGTKNSDVTVENNSAWAGKLGLRVSF